MHLATRRNCFFLIIGIVSAWVLWVINADIRYLLMQGKENPNTLHVVEATYGGNCIRYSPTSGEAVKIGNATVFASQYCDNTDVFCPVPLELTKLGNPAAGCAKDFSISWRCGLSQALHHYYLAPEAISHVIWVRCPAQEP
jgi:hypothetical protein